MASKNLPKTYSSISIPWYFQQRHSGFKSLHPQQLVYQKKKKATESLTTKNHFRGIYVPPL